ncbi:MAG TPA: NAD(P)/FAD-dependent oxidoreductase [Chloroflexota bacterium]|nr:NAD(P)/FAD-dependent oxidoreductase [Chloroflexota bacterium]
MKFDVIVAGAGPAGSTVARECAARGMAVLMLEKAVFPRDKPCGGGVNVRAAKLLPFDLAPVTERVIDSMTISVRQNRAYRRQNDGPLSYLTQRLRLDAFLAERAVRAGADLRERCAVREVERRGDGVEVRAAGETFAGRALVVADGANGRTAAAAGVRVPRIMGIALEGNVTPEAFPGNWERTFAIDVGSVPGGYGWLFPKGEHLNVGVGGWYGVGPTLRPRLDSLARYYGFEPDDLWGLRGHPLPVRLPQAPLFDGNVLLVGDAAGLLDPLTGEGIYAAFRSGETAARHLAAALDGDSNGLAGYEAEIRRDLIPELWAGTQLHALFQLFPPAWAAFVGHSGRAWRLVCALLTGEISYAGIKDRSWLLRAGIDGAAAAVFAGARARRRWHGEVALPSFIPDRASQ